MTIWSSQSVIHAHRTLKLIGAQRTMGRWSLGNRVKRKDIFLNIFGQDWKVWASMSKFENNFCQPLLVTNNDWQKWRCSSSKLVFWSWMRMQSHQIAITIWPWLNLHSYMVYNIVRWAWISCHARQVFGRLGASECVYKSECRYTCKFTSPNVSALVNLQVQTSLHL